MKKMEQSSRRKQIQNEIQNQSFFAEKNCHSRNVFDFFLIQKHKKMHVVQNCQKPKTVKSLKEHRKEAPVLFKSKFVSHRYWIFQVRELPSEGFYKTNPVNTALRYCEIISA